MADRARPGRGGRRGGCDRRSARGGADRNGCTATCRSRHPARRDRGRGDRCAGPQGGSPPRRWTLTPHFLRSRRDGRRLEPGHWPRQQHGRAADLVGRGADLPARRDISRPRPGRCGGRSFFAGRSAPKRRHAGGRSRRGSGQDGNRSPLHRPRRAGGRSPAVARAGTRQGVRRLPARRDRQGHRAFGARGVRLDRASQALHHAGHGDRPGQDQPAERPRAARRRHRQVGRGGGHRAVACALPVGRDRRVRRPSSRSAFPPRTVDRQPRLGRRPGRELRRRRPVEARAVVPAAGRARLARQRQSRSGDDPRRGRHLRRLQRSARSMFRGRTPAPCSIGSTSTAFPRSRSARRATASCCGRTGW